MVAVASAESDGKEELEVGGAIDKVTAVQGARFGAIKEGDAGSIDAHNHGGSRRKIGDDDGSGDDAEARELGAGVAGGEVILEGIGQEHEVERFDAEDGAVLVKASEEVDRTTGGGSGLKLEAGVGDFMEAMETDGEAGIKGEGGVHGGVLNFKKAGGV